MQLPLQEIQFVEAFQKNTLNKIINYEKNTHSFVNFSCY